MLFRASFPPLQAQGAEALEANRNAQRDQIEVLLVRQAQLYTTREFTEDLLLFDFLEEEKVLLTRPPYTRPPVTLALTHARATAPALSIAPAHIGIACCTHCTPQGAHRRILTLHGTGISAEAATSRPAANHGRERA